MQESVSIENLCNVKQSQLESDEIFKYDANEQKKILNSKPWLRRYVSLFIQSEIL